MQMAASAQIIERHGVVTAAGAPALAPAGLAWRAGAPAAATGAGDAA